LTDDASYLFDNRASETGDRFDALASLFDPVTIRHLDMLGVGDGWRCLDVGAGGGSIARWLGRRVGTSGRVLAADIDTRWLAARANGPNVDVQQLNIVVDPLPEAAFDLVHERLVLLHLPERRAVLHRLASALRPGGRLLVEDFDATLTTDYIDPQSDDEALGNRIMTAVRALLTKRGADVELGHKLPALLREEGLEDVGADAYQAIALGEPTRQLHRANVTQVAEQLVEQTSVTQAEIDRYLHLLERGVLSPSSTVLVSAWGTRSR
jgi:SAM-dependent methyltransferase